MAVWDPATYLQFADERSRPFYDLVTRISAVDPRSVVDLGCGPGQLTASLAERWQTAQLIGLDSSAEMIDTAQQYASERVRFILADLRAWQPASPVDVIISNAALQWVPGHRALFPRLVTALAAGGCLAFQVPGNFGAPSHQLLRRLAADPRFAAATGQVETPEAFDPAVYLGDLAALGCAVDAWETTHLHVLSGRDPVYRWMLGTGARPVLQALPDELREQFVAEYQALLRTAYPARPYGTVLPYRRVYVVARRASPPAG
jgi:trans-aconitate 2-methyltransferase